MAAPPPSDDDLVGWIVEPHPNQAIARFPFEVLDHELDEGINVVLFSEGL